MTERLLWAILILTAADAATWFMPNDPNDVDDFAAKLCVLAGFVGAGLMLWWH